MKRCLVFLDGQALQDSIDLLEVARQIYPAQAYESTGITFGSETGPAEGAFDTIIQVRDDRIPSFDPMALTEVLVELHQLR